MAGEGDLLSTLREQLVAQLRRFDDDALVALANKGLLRRAQKDLEKSPPVSVEEGADEVTVALGEIRVRFDARGPAHAKCSCPATSVCQHILAAVLFLQRAASAGTDAPATPTAASAASATSAAPAAASTGGQPSGSNAPAHDPTDIDALATLQAELAHITTAELTKHAGKAGYRWAWQFVQDLDAEHGFTASGERHVILTFSRPRMTFRYLGGGLANMIADLEVARIEKYRVAAVLAWQRARGVDLTPPEPVGGARNAGLDFGKDHATGSPDPENLTESRNRLLASGQQLICECLELGLSHLSRGIYERFETLGVWAQGVEYYRLALLLRRIADQVENLLERTGAADEHALLDEITLAYGLMAALQGATSQNKAPARLVGAARSRYESMQNCELLGLGALPWRSPTGYVGLTLIFWSPAEQEFLSCSDARPEGQRGFDARARYKASGPWSGLGAPSMTTGRRVQLSAPQINAAGRLSGSDKTSAIILPQQTATEFVAALQPLSSWPEALQARTATRLSLLATPQPMKDWVVLRPQRFGPARFDEARQVLVWPLFDAEDNRLDAELAYDEYTAHAIARIEALKPTASSDGVCLVARLHPGLNSIAAEPLSLVRPNATGDSNVVDALHFDTAPDPGMFSQLLARLRSGSPGTTPLRHALHRVPGFFIEYREELRRRAERGIGQGAGDGNLASLWAQKAADRGLTAFKQVAEGSATAATALLRANYVRLQYERVLGMSDDEA